MSREVDNLPAPLFRTTGLCKTCVEDLVELCKKIDFGFKRAFFNWQLCLQRRRQEI